MVGYSVAILVFLYGHSNIWALSFVVCHISCLSNVLMIDTFGARISDLWLPCVTWALDLQKVGAPTSGSHSFILTFPMCGMRGRVISVMAGSLNLHSHTRGTGSYLACSILLGNDTQYWETSWSLVMQHRLRSMPNSIISPSVYHKFNFEVRSTIELSSKSDIPSNCSNYCQCVLILLSCLHVLFS